MKTDFAQILIPKGTPSPTESNETLTYKQSGRRNSSNTSLFLLLATSVIFIVGVTVLTTVLVLKYEERMTKNEERITKVEKFMKDMGLWGEEVLEYESHPHSFDMEEDEDYDEGEEDEGLLLGGGEHKEIFIDEMEQEISNRFMPKQPKEFKGESDEEEEEEEQGTMQVGQFGKVTLEEEEEKEAHPRGRRNRRQVPFPSVPTFGPEVERTRDGVPIVDESYLSTHGFSLKPRLHTTPSSSDSSEGLRLYERLVESPRDHYSRPRPQLRNLDTNSTNSHNNPGVLPHHQVSAAWSEDQGQRSRVQLKSGDYTSSSNELGSSTYTRRSQRQNSRYSPTSNPFSSNSNTFVVSGGGGNSGATYHRNSRVPTTGEYFYPTTRSTYSSRAQYPHQAPLRKMTVGNGEGEVIARVVQTDRDVDNEAEPSSHISAANIGQSAAEASYHRSQRQRQRPVQRQTQQDYQGEGITSHAQTQSFQGGRKYSRKNNPEDSGEISIVKAEAWVESPKPLAAHYVADVSNYTTAHRHYDGNGRLRNADGIFEAWRPADWMSADGAGDGTKAFLLSTNGVLTVKKAGLYYVYAQIHYLDDHDINGFVLQVNTEPFLQCTTMTETYQAGSKSNSCFTAGIQYLKENDRIMIKDIETNRYSIFKPEKSFFGLMKVGVVP